MLLKKLFHKLVTKVNAINTSKFVLKTQKNIDKSGFQKKIDAAIKKLLDPNGLFKKTDYNTKVTDIQGKISSITGVATAAALNAVENEILKLSQENRL